MQKEISFSVNFDASVEASLLGDECRVITRILINRVGQTPLVTQVVCGDESLVGEVKGVLKKVLEASAEDAVSQVMSGALPQTSPTPGGGVFDPKAPPKPPEPPPPPPPPSPVAA